MVARYRCPQARMTFSLLPDCLPSRFPGTLAEMEQVVALQETIGTGAAATQLRPEQEPEAVTLPSATRWVQRRERIVHAGLLALIGLLPEVFTGVDPTVEAMRKLLGMLPVLGLLREIAAAHLHVLPPALGFGPRPQRRGNRRGLFQHSMGPDPP